MVGTKDQSAVGTISQIAVGTNDQEMIQLLPSLLLLLLVVTASCDHAKKRAPFDWLGNRMGALYFAWSQAPAVPLLLRPM